MSAVKEAPKATNGPAQEKEITPRKSVLPGRWYGSPFATMRRFAEEMDRAFEEFGLGSRFHFPSMFTRGRELLRRETGMIPAEWSPRVEVLEKEGYFVVRAELPGLTKDDVKAEIMENVLTITGERKQEKKEEHEGYSYSECSYCSFYRAIPLPEGVEVAKATADCKNGVLEVTIPVVTPPQPKTRRLEVR